MNGGEESHSAIVAVKPPNKAERSVAEAVEPRAGTEGNAEQGGALRTPNREGALHGLDRVRKAARERKKERFTALWRHITVDLLEEAFRELRKNASPGIDGLTWETYERDLGRRLEDLYSRVRRGAYRALPSRRVYIPKPDGRQRPLAVAALEDKIVQRATATVLNAVYEEDFLGFSYGFRPGRGAHDAMDALVVGITARKVNWILDADIEKFFDSVSQEWLIRFVEHRIGDKRILRLIQKWLRAGVLEDGVVTTSDRGTGQGSVISPLLANVYLYYAFDLWANLWRKQEATGEMIIVRYADDIIVGFQHEADARRFWDAMRERLKGFALSLHPDKTRLIEFGRFAAANRKRRGLGKASTSSAGNLQFPGLHLHQRQIARRQIPDSQDEPTRPRVGEAHGDQGGAAAAHASVDTRTGQVARAGRGWLVQLSRRADQQPCARGLPLPRHGLVATHASAAERQGQDDLGADDPAGKRLPSQTDHPSPLAQRPLRRQTPEVRTVCPNRARTGPCGGRSAMSVPTAIRNPCVTGIRGIRKFDVASGASTKCAARHFAAAPRRSFPVHFGESIIPALNWTFIPVKCGLAEVFAGEKVQRLAEENVQC